MNDPEVEREATRIVADAHERAEKVKPAFVGVRNAMIRAAERKAELIRSGTWLGEVSTRSLTPRDLLGLDGQRRATVHRPCLRCRAPFDSHGPGNRLCPACRAQSAEASPYAL